LIDADGNLIIGTLAAAPATKVTVVGNLSAQGTFNSYLSGGTATNFNITNLGTGNSLVVNDAADDRTPFIVTSNGHVIIGGTVPSPSAILTVYGDISGTTDPATGFGGSFINGNNFVLPANRATISNTLAGYFGTSILLKANNSYELEYNVYSLNLSAGQTYDFKLSSNNTFSNVVAVVIQDTSGRSSADINTFASNGVDGPIINLGASNQIYTLSAAVYSQIRALVQVGVSATSVSLALSTNGALGAIPLQGSYRKVTLFK